MKLSLIYALLSTLSFSLASVAYAVFSQKISAMWMNAFKATIAFIAFAIALVAMGQWTLLPGFEAFSYLFIGGFIGLNIGDYFLLKAFERIGAARTLIIFSFHPLFMAIFAYYLFAQSLTPLQFIAIFFLIACALTVSYEKFKLHGHWEWLGPVLAGLGVLLDCVSVIMTRYAFDIDSNVTVISANFYRCFGACAGFFVFAQFYPIKFRRRFKRMRFQTKWMVFTASLFGTFIALWFYLAAIKTGYLAKISAVIGSGPLFTAAFECLWQRKLPNRYLWYSLLLFFIGVGLLLLNF